MGLLFRFASQWVAGEEMAPALDRIAERNRDGMGAVLNVLGEHYRDPAAAARALREYLAMVEAMHARKLDACLSAKPTQLGLGIDYPTFLGNARRLLEACRAAGMFLWLDMESAAFTEDTLRAYRELLRASPQVGVCLQANLRRTREDLEQLCDLKGRVRLVKGAYREDARTAYRSRRDIDASMLSLVEVLFQRGEGFAVASHDAKVVDKAITMNKVHPKTFEFQFLLGVRETLKRELVAKGYRVLEYVPYGRNWLPYFTRRLRERPRNIFTMLRSLVSG
ncbi:MAG TPA: proline dehydrogenase family protein [Thermoplasmata archaeon]|nr:proline dehydrogenase family protein [Thermoplasmata archaeon]